ncbi:unnamed protein product [Brassica oleracea var. botrytis]
MPTLAYNIILLSKISNSKLTAGNILHGGATETLVDLIGSAVIFTTGVTQSGVSFEINLSYLVDVFLDVRLCFCVEINFKETKIRSVSG